MYTGHFPAASNSADWSVQFEMIDEDTGLAFDLTGYSIEIAIRSDKSQNPSLTGTLDDYISLSGDAADGVFVVSFPEAQMSDLCAGTYNVGIVLTSGAGTKTQLLACTLPVVDGIVH